MRTALRRLSGKGGQRASTPTTDAVRARRSCQGRTHDRGVWRIWLWALYALCHVLAPPTLHAYQTLSNSGTNITGTNISATKAFPSTLTTTLTVSGTETAFFASNTTLNSIGSPQSSFYAPSIATTTPGAEFDISALGCPNAGACPSRGTLTISFNRPVRNPVLHISGIGGTTTLGSAFITYHTILTLSSSSPAGANFSLTAANGNMQVIGGTTIDVVNTTHVGTSCSSLTAPFTQLAGCGSVRVNGTVSSLTLAVGMFTTNNGVSPLPTLSSTSVDGIVLAITADEDFGDAPASFDPTAAASTMLSDLRLGSSVDADNTNTLNAAGTPITPSPNAVSAGATNNGSAGDGTEENGLSTFPALTTLMVGLPYSVPVTISGASAPGQVCGWIDFNRNNVFNNPGERACSSFTAGATSVTLTWTVPAGISAGQNYARLIASYNTTQVQTPTGRIDSGEVEDYLLFIGAGYDYGDAPDTGAGTGPGNYQTTSADNGPRHVRTAVPTVFLGTQSPDIDDGTLRNAAATADDANGSDDEDGVASVPSLSPTASSYQITVTVTNTSGNAATLIGWLDFNRNGVFEATEASVTSVPSSASAVTTTLLWTGVSGKLSGSGNLYLRLRLSTDLLTNSSGNQGTVADGEIEDYLVPITATTSSVTGRVFRDATSGGASGDNDGILNGSEQGLPEVSVALIDCTTGPSGPVLGTAVTDGNGQYSLPLPDKGLISGTSQLCVVETNPHGYLSTGASHTTTALGTSGGETYTRSTDTIRFPYTAGTTYAGFNFGDVPVHTLAPDGQRTALPGGVLFYPHTFTAGAGGTVTFSASNVAAPAITGWTLVLYHDANCNALLDASESQLTGGLTVTADARVCLLVKEFVPATAPLNAQDLITVTALFTYTNAAPALSTSLSRTDLTIVSTEAVSDLVLSKSVDKPTALPGDVLTYTLTYTNIGATPLNTLTVNDTTPAFTIFLSASCGTPLPANLTACAVSTQPAVHASGALQWTLTGPLAPGGTGTVSYQVRIN